MSATGDVGTAEVRVGDGAWSSVEDARLSPASASASAVWFALERTELWKFDVAYHDTDPTAVPSATTTASARTSAKPASSFALVLIRFDNCGSLLLPKQHGPDRRSWSSRVIGADG